MRKWNIKWHLRAGLVAALLAISSGAQADTYCSVKSLGMGGVATAYGQDSLTAFFNPATAGEVESRFDLEFDTTWNHKKLTLSDRPAGSTSGTFTNNHRWDFYGAGGFNYRFGCCDEWAAGIQWNNVNSVHTRYQTAISDFSGTSGQAPRFGYRLDALTFTGAYNFDNTNTIGIGLNVYFGWLQVNGLANIATISSDPGNVTNNGTDTSVGVGATIGYLGRFCDDQLSLGIAYSTKAHMSDFKKYSGLLPGGELSVPDVLRVGLAYQYDCAMTIAADYEWHRWSSSRGWSNNFNLGVTTPRFGDNNGPGFGYRDQSIVKVGLDYQVDPCMVARLGYRWEQVPFRNNGGSAAALNALTANVIQNYITAGLTYSWDCCTELSWFGEYGFKQNSRTSFPDVGVGGIVFEGGNVSLQSQRFSTGVAYGVKF